MNEPSIVCNRLCNPKSLNYNDENNVFIVLRIFWSKTSPVYTSLKLDHEVYFDKFTVYTNRYKVQPTPMLPCGHASSRQSLEIYG
jgi:hypothetical protein